MKSKTITFSTMLILCAILARGQTPFSGTSGNFTTDSKLPLIEVLAPNGGETFNYLEPLQVTWTATDDSFGTNPISIAISTENGGAFTIVASNLPNTGSATVTPPGIQTEFAKVKVIGLDDFGIEGTDESDSYFTFDNSFSGYSANFITDSKPPVVSVISPNGGEAYYFANPLEVEWNATDDSFGATPVTVLISTDGGTTYTDVANGLPNTGLEPVAAPQEITDLAMVKVFVQDEFGLTAFDESDAVFSLHGVYIDLKAFLQGPFAGSGMLTFLNMQGYLPTAQPYNTSPWGYSGTETADPIPNSDVVDWVLIEIRQAPDAASATEATAIAQRAGFVLNDGTVKDIDGADNLQFGIEVTDNLFAVIYHRNHLPVMSSGPLTETAGVFAYDFTASATAVYGGMLAHSELVPGTWGMTSGDANADGDIDNVDKDDVWLPDRYSSGYYPGDFDMNGTVLDSDKETWWEENSGKSRKLP